MHILRIQFECSRRSTRALSPVDFVYDNLFNYTDLLHLMKRPKEQMMKLVWAFFCFCCILSMRNYRHLSHRTHRIRTHTMDIHLGSIFFSSFLFIFFSSLAGTIRMLGPNAKIGREVMCKFQQFEPHRMCLSSRIAFTHAYTAIPPPFFAYHLNNTRPYDSNYEFARKTNTWIDQRQNNHKKAGK